MSRGKQLALRIVGIACILMALIGYAYTFGNYWFIREQELNPETPYFFEAYLIMAIICLLFYSVLFILGVMFLALKTKYSKVFYFVIVAELLYFLGIGFSWRVSDESIAYSIGAATGVANGGLSFQGLSLFVFWAPLLIMWVNRKAKS